MSSYGKTIRGFKMFTTKCINEEPEGNYCWYNIWPEVEVTDELLDELQKYVDKKHIQYLFIVNNVEEARPQRSGMEPEFYRPTSMMRYFSENRYQNNTFFISFWGENWFEEKSWDLDKILEGMKDFPEYSTIIRLEGKYEQGEI